MAMPNTMTKPGPSDLRDSACLSESASNDDRPSPDGDALRSRGKRPKVDGNEIVDALKVGTASKQAVTRIISDIPDNLPVLSSEIDLIATYLPDVLALIAANDNEPT